MFWLPFAINKIWKIHKATPIDLLIASVPPFTTAIIAVILKKYLNCPILVDFRDAWTKSPYLLSLTKIHHYLQSKMESKVIHSADIFVFVNPYLKNYYIQKYNSLSQNSTHVVRNGFDKEDFVFKNDLQKRINADVFKIGIMGTVYSQGNSPLPLIKVIYDVLNKNPKLKGKIKIYLIGKWTGYFIEKVNSYKMEKEIEWVKYLLKLGLIRKARMFFIYVEMIL